MRKFIAILLILSLIPIMAFAEGETSSNSVDGNGIEVIEPTPEPTLEPTPTPIPKSVTIYWNARPVMEVGEMVTIFSELVGFEDCEEIRYQWKCDSGAGYEPIPGATEPTYSFPASAEALSCGYRLTVYYK